MSNPELEIANALSHQFGLIIPELFLGIMACVLFLGGTFRKGRQLWGFTAIVSLAAATFALRYHSALDPRFLGVLPFTYDRFAVIIKAVTLLGGAIIILIGWDEVSDKEAADYYGCLLVLLAGACLTGAANDLVSLFLALELISIPTYVILYLHRTDLPAQESAAKYFLLSVFSSGLLLFGFSYLYGVTGSTNLTAILDSFSRLASPEAAATARDWGTPLIALVALVMIVAGLGFRITAVPFHFYAPDVYQGTTASVAGLLAFAPKVAGFAALLRVLGFLFADPHMPPGQALGQQAPVLFWILAAMTMTVGNVLALLQDNLKRLLAYSSVAHAGYMLIGLAIAPGLAHHETTGGVDAVLFYLVAYGAMTLGPFGVIAYLSSRERPIETIDDLAGLSESHPGIALMMAVFLFSLIGIPLTAGFAGKMLLFMGALAVPAEPEATARLFRWLAILGAINAAAGAWYYLRIVSAMYLRSPLQAISRPTAWAPLAGLWVCVVITLGLGIYPAPLLKAARQAVLPISQAIPEAPSKPVAALVGAEGDR